MNHGIKKLSALTTSLCLSLVIGLSACTKEVVTEKLIKADEAQKPEGQDMIVEVNDKMDAEQLALAGEQLVGPATFMLAQKAFDMSLTKDKTNKRAQFYTALLKPFMVYKGIGIRLKPIIRLHGDIANHEKVLARIPNSPFRDFILDGKEDVKNIADAQSYLMEMQKAWNETRVFLLNNSNLNLTINLNPHIFKEAIENEINESCQLTRIGSSACSYVDGSYTCGPNSINSSSEFEVTCNYRGAAQRKINAADIIYLRQITAGMVFTYNMYTTYSLEDIDQLLILDRDGRMTSEQRNRFIEDNLPEVGKLRKDNQFKQILDIGSDLAAAANWAVKYQSQLCPKGYGEKRQRPGFLLSNGICIEHLDKTKQDIAILEQILKGAIETYLEVPGQLELPGQGNINGYSKYEKTKIDYLAWVRNPIQDLREVAPLTYNRCGEAASLKDKTFGGIYPNGDAEKFMLSPCNR